MTPVYVDLCVPRPLCKYLQITDQRISAMTAREMGLVRRGRQRRWREGSKMSRCGHSTHKPRFKPEFKPQKR